ncbi:MAG: hypothetical protein OEV55_06325 [candidate division Zixibacteria bacterium]|nr:hypothetical protein [candidate division Zixibacteria bacterium]
MNITLDYLRGRRVWLVKNFCVWGSYSAIDFIFICSETRTNSKRIIFNRFDLGGYAQEVIFSSLYDFKGNQLPQSIKSPKVVTLPKNETICMVTEENDNGFKIVQKSGSVENGLVDLLIMEMG